MNEERLDEDYEKCYAKFWRYTLRKEEAISIYKLILIFPILPD